MSFLYSRTCLRWSLYKAATSLKQPASQAPDSNKALESISVEQPPLCNGQLQQARRRLSQPGFTVIPSASPVPGANWHAVHSMC